MKNQFLAVLAGLLVSASAHCSDVKVVDPNALKTGTVYAALAACVAGVTSYASGVPLTANAPVQSFVSVVVAAPIFLGWYAPTDRKYILKGFSGTVISGATLGAAGYIALKALGR